MLHNENTKDVVGKSNLLDLAQTEGYYLLDFWAGWCGPCRFMLPILKRILEDAELKDKLTLLKINADADENQELIGEFDVSGLPTFVLIKSDGKGGYKVLSENFTGTQDEISFKTKLIELVTQS